MAVYGGKRKIMKNVSPLGKVYQAGTLSGNPIATTAGIKTIELLMDHPELYSQIEAKTKRLADAYRQYSKKTGIPICVNQIGSLMSAFFTDQKVVDYATATTSDTKAYAKYFNELLEKGIYVAPSQFEAMFVSGAHTDEDIDNTVKALLG